MSPDPSDRYPSARALAEAIDAWLGRRRSRGHSIALGVISVLLGTAGLLAAFLSRPVGNNQAPATATVARLESPEKQVVPASKAANARARSEPLRAGQLVTSSKGKKYHIVPCRHADEIEERNRLILESPEDARRRGRQPCDTCRPPAARAEVPPPAEKGAATSQGVRGAG